MAVPFEEWMSVEGPALKRAAVLLCRDEHEADDLVQDTFVRLYAKWNSVGELGNPAGYAQRTLTNVYLSRLRRLRLERSKQHLFTTAQGPNQIEAVTDGSALTTWLGSLGTKQRAAVVWHYYYDLPVPEIAALLGCRESTVRTQLARALTNMRRFATARERT